MAGPNSTCVLQAENCALKTSNQELQRILEPRRMARREFMYQTPEIAQAAAVDVHMNRMNNGLNNWPNRHASFTVGSSGRIGLAP